ncbi:TOBE domain-containing protein [Klebsiella variicola]|uniref:TOBE domain-containing protein n=1 Tax=Klebsiella variicola TaxID=244366 RepID=UPI00396C3668
MSVSARNQLHGKVSAIHPGSVNDEIEISLNEGGKLVSVVTRSGRCTKVYYYSLNTWNYHQKNS